MPARTHQPVHSPTRGWHTNRANAKPAAGRGRREGRRARTTRLATHRCAQTRPSPVRRRPRKAFGRLCGSAARGHIRPGLAINSIAAVGSSCATTARAISDGARSVAKPSVTSSMSASRWCSTHAFSCVGHRATVGDSAHRSACPTGRSNRVGERYLYSTVRAV